MSRSFISFVFLFLVLASCSDQTGVRRTYVLTTGTTGGTFYPVGVALSTLVTAQATGQDSGQVANQDIRQVSGQVSKPDSKQSKQRFSLTAISSAGSMENIKLMRDNQAQFGLILGIFGAWAWEGVGPIKNPQSHLRSISAMWPNVEHFVLSTDLVTDGTLSDLGKIAGERYVLGMRNSGAEQTGIYILDALGIDYNKLNLGYMGYGASASALQDGNIVGMNIPAGAPVTAITQAYAQVGNGMTVLDFTDAELAAINREFPLWASFELPPETYPYQEQPIRTASSPNILITRNDVPDEIVYSLTKLLWDNLATLQEIHSATKAMVLEEALQGVLVPLHPGAIRYYREQGVEIPEQLLPESSSEDR